jgi:hypothetical protein
MSVPQTQVTQAVKALNTPDPIMTSEALAVAAVAFISNIYVLFVSSGLSPEAKNGIAGLITGGWLLGQFFYSAYIRAARAKAGGLLQLQVHEVPIEGSDPGDKRA